MFDEMGLKVSCTFCDIYVLVLFRSCVNYSIYSVFVIPSDFSLLFLISGEVFLCSRVLGLAG